MKTSYARGRPRGFTLIEIMVATVIMVILMGIIFQLTASMAEIWRSTAGKISAFQGSRSGFDALSRSLEQATLMTYFDYVDAQVPPQPRASSNESFKPTRYARASELHFLCGPAYEPAGPSRSLISGATANNVQGHAIFYQAALGLVSDTSEFGGLGELLNSVGFYVEYTDDKPVWPSFIQSMMGSTPRFRFRLMQWVQPSERFSVYRSSRPNGSDFLYDRSWFKDFLPEPGSSSITSLQTRSRMIAEDVIAVFFRPRLSDQDEDQLDGAPNNSATGGRLAPTYRYDSRLWEKEFASAGGDPTLLSATFGPSSIALVDLMRNQLPPLIDVVMISIDPKEADRLCRQSEIPEELRIPSNTFHLRTEANAADFLFNPDVSGQSDIEKYEAQLSAARVNYRVFRATLNVKGAKWSVE